MKKETAEIYKKMQNQQFILSKHKYKVQILLSIVKNRYIIILCILSSYL